MHDSLKSRLINYVKIQLISPHDNNNNSKNNNNNNNVYRNKNNNDNDNYNNNFNDNTNNCIDNIDNDNASTIVVMKSIRNVSATNDKINEKFKSVTLGEKAIKINKKIPLIKINILFTKYTC